MEGWVRGSGYAGRPVYCSIAAALLLLLCLSQTPVPAAAQNSASAPAPVRKKIDKDKQDKDKPDEEEQGADHSNPTDQPAPNAATADAKPKPAATNQPAAATADPQAASTNAAPASTSDSIGSAQVDPASERKNRMAPPDVPPAGKSASTVEGVGAAGNVAEGNANPQPMGVTEAGIIKMPSNNSAFPYLVQAPTTAPGQTPPPPIAPFIPDSPMVPNSAEARPGTSQGTNQAINPQANIPAEPPTPMIPTPEPGAIAGPPEPAPQLQLEVPDIEMLPPPLPEGEYITPERSYLQERPLPPLDQTQTEEQRQAQNVEQSIKLINLGAEQRTPVQMPLAPGQLAYSADQQMQIDQKNRKYIFVGNAAVYYGDIAVWADRIEVNDSASNAYATGYVAVQRQDDILYCDEAYINYDTKTLELFKVEGNTGSPHMQGRAYFFANRAYGTFDRLILDAPSLTTCDPFCGSPKEVHISAHKGIYKARRAIDLDDVYVYVREHKIAYIPVLVIPMPRNKKAFENENSDLQQDYGYDYLDGLYAKFAYTYFQRHVDPDKVQNGGPLLGVAKLDLSQKRGPGYGIRQDLYNPNLGITTITAYYQQEWGWRRPKLDDGTRAAPERNLAFSFNQELNLSKALQGKAVVNRSDIITPSTTTIQGGRRTQRTNTWNNSFDLEYRKGDTDARINGTQSIDITGGQPNQVGNQLRRVNSNTNVTTSVDQNITDELHANVGEVYSSIKGQQSSIAADQEGTFSASVNFTPKADSPLAGYTAQARVQQMQDLDKDKNRTAQDQNRQIHEEFPSIQIGLPRDLLGKNNYFNSFQINLDNLVTGTRRRPEAAFRTKISASGSSTAHYGRSSTLGTRLGLSQYWYDDGNAQYIIQPNVTYNYDSFNGWRFGATYDLQFQQGVRNPPVSGDAQRYRQSFDYNAELTNYRSWRWRLSSGFDLTHEPYTPTADPNDVRWYSPRPLSSTFTWDPNRTASFATTMSYNFLTDTWSPTRVGFTLRSPYVAPDGYYNWYLGFGMDTDTNYWDKWQTTSLDVDWFKKYERGWSSEVIGSFRPRSGTAHTLVNGVDTDTHEPLTGIEDQRWDDLLRLIRLRKQNCCTTLEFGWRVSINEVYVNAYLNALPQYPLTVTSDNPFSGPGDKDFFFQSAFPTEAVFNDIQQELFPGSQSIPGLL